MYDLTFHFKNATTLTVRVKSYTVIRVMPRVEWFDVDDEYAPMLEQIDMTEVNAIIAQKVRPPDPAFQAMADATKGLPT